MHERFIHRCLNRKKWFVYRNFIRKKINSSRETLLILNRETWHGGRITQIFHCTFRFLKWQWNRKWCMAMTCMGFFFTQQMLNAQMIFFLFRISEFCMRDLCEHIHHIAVKFLSLTTNLYNWDIIEERKRKKVRKWWIALSKVTAKKWFLFNMVMYIVYKMCKQGNFLSLWWKKNVKKILR